MSHHGFVRGLVENGCEVDVLMPSESFGPLDPGLPRIEGVRYHLHSSLSLRDGIVARARSWFDGGPSPGAREAAGPGEAARRQSLPGEWRRRLRLTVSSSYASWARRDPHRSSRAWLRRAGRFASSRPYDLVFSNSSPASGHRLAATLLASGRVRGRRWLQVWEDPWYHDVYRRGPAPGVLEEEAALLRAAHEIFYVSPLTLEYQRRYFPDVASKMGLVPLPAFPVAGGAERPDLGRSPVFGYFGDYYSHTRDLRPFHAALTASGATAEICGDTDLRLQSTERIRVRGRVTLPELREIESGTDVMVALCNLRGGQLPGKLYHYAATSKPVLLVLDGSEDEREAIRSHFEPLGRFEFCENEASAIEDVLRDFHEGRRPLVASPEPSFEARAVVGRLLGRTG